MKLLIDSNGVTTNVFHTGPDGYVIQTRQDVEPVIEANKLSQTMDSTYSPSRELRHVARIPLNIYNLWIQQGMPMDDTRERMKWIKKKLNDPDWRYLKTSHEKERFRLYT